MGCAECQREREFVVGKEQVAPDAELARGRIPARRRAWVPMHFAVEVEEQARVVIDLARADDERFRGGLAVRGEGDLLERKNNLPARSGPQPASASTPIIVTARTGQHAPPASRAQASTDATARRRKKNVAPVAPEEAGADASTRRWRKPVNRAEHRVAVDGFGR